jgi:RNA polymerase sigma factor for flagellar operon FliA
MEQMLNQGMIQNEADKARESAERRLWEDYRRNSDKGAAHRALVEHYIPLVVKIVERLSIRVRQQIEKQELLSVGVLGLHHAIRGFSKDRGVSFASYAQKRIKGSILDELRRQDHLSRSQRKEYRDICAKIRIFTEENGRPPTDDEIAEAAGATIEHIRYLIDIAGAAVSLHDTSRHGTPYVDVIADERDPLPSELADKQFVREALRDAFRKLEPRDQQLMFLRHHEELRVKEIAAVLGVSEGRVSQMYKEIVIKLRAFLKIET